MSTDAKPALPTTTEPTIQHRQQGIKIFMWPKVIFLYPTALVSLICAAGMSMIEDRTHDPTRPLSSAVSREYRPQGSTDAGVVENDTVNPNVTKLDRFWTAQNLLGMFFLSMLAFNLLTMGLDLPRFTIVAWIFAAGFVVFFLLWLGTYFQLDLMRPVHWIISHIYAVANRGFYLMVFVTLMFVFLVIYVTRWLDYWEVLPNEILHHHGPLSDLERYPTMNLKFDKEIPDVLEFILLGAGRLVLHVPNVSKALVLDNVLFINKKEEALKRVMSRLEVRVTTDQEAGDATV